MHEPDSDNSYSREEVVEWLEVVHGVELLHVDERDSGLEAEHHGALPDAEHQLEGRATLRHVRGDSQTVHVLAYYNKFVQLKVLFDEASSVLQMQS